MQVFDACRPMLSERLALSRDGAVRARGAACGRSYVRFGAADLSRVNRDSSIVRPACGRRRRLTPCSRRRRSRRRRSRPRSRLACARPHPS